MAGKYSYDDFTKAATNAGLLNQFDESDLRLAQSNPDAGMSLLQYKIDYNKEGATDQQKALANAGAENIRSTFGGYTAGTDGSGYYMTGTPSSFTYNQDAPSYSSQYDAEADNRYQALADYGTFSYGDAPTYNSRYDDQLQGMLTEYLNREDFSYDPKTDPLTGQYMKQYAREGRRASADALAQAAAASGGMSNSYAATASQQAANYYAAQAADKIPELYQLAYQKYLSDYDMARSDIDVVRSYEDADYQKYLNELGQFNTDRSLAYSVWNDDYSHQNNALNQAQNLREFDYQKYLDQQEQYNADRDFAYGQYADQIHYETNADALKWDKAVEAANLGDYSLLEELGVKPTGSSEKWDRQYQIAAAMYDATGDTRYLRALAGTAFGDTVSTTTPTENDIKTVQRYLGVDADGIWGPISEAAAGGMTEAEAWEAYQKGTLTK